MIALSGNTPIYLSTRPTDMRKSFDGLCGEVVDYLGQEPTSGHLFVFLNRRRDLMKILVWDRHGFWVLGRRLEAGRFEVPRYEPQQRSVSLSYEQLVLILEGIELNSVRQRRRYRQESRAA
jgi:transposase